MSPPLSQYPVYIIDDILQRNDDYLPQSGEDNGIAEMEAHGLLSSICFTGFIPVSFESLFAQILILNG